MHVRVEETVAEHLVKKISMPSRESFLKSTPASRRRSTWLIGTPCIRSITSTLSRQ